MLRRFESYAFAPGTAAQQDDLARVLRRAGLFIPEVLDSAVGRNRSAAGAELVWEQAYDDPDAYARYMCHPFHICILDRYLLPEAPECITAPRGEVGLGLFGYEIDGNPYRRDGGIRRVVLLKTDARDAFLDELRARPELVPEMRVSIVERNSMGLEWFPDGFTHVWEQSYDDEASMARAIASEAALLSSSPVVDWADLWYEMDVDPAAPSSAAEAAGQPVP